MAFEVSIALVGAFNMNRSSRVTYTRPRLIPPPGIGQFLTSTYRPQRPFERLLHSKTSRTSYALNKVANVIIGLLFVRRSSVALPSFLS